MQREAYRRSIEEQGGDADDSAGWEPWEACGEYREQTEGESDDYFHASHVRLPSQCFSARCCDDKLVAFRHAYAFWGEGKLELEELTADIVAGVLWHKEATGSYPNLISLQNAEEDFTVRAMNNGVGGVAFVVAACPPTVCVKQRGRGDQALLRRSLLPRANGANGCCG